MITKTPKIIYIILAIILVIAADAWRRSWLSSDISVSQAVSPLRKSIREIKQELQETKSLWLEQRAATAALDDKIKRIDKLILNQTEKNLEIADQSENKILDELVNGITDNSSTSLVKNDDFPDLNNLVSTVPDSSDKTLNKTRTTVPKKQPVKKKTSAAKIAKTEKPVKASIPSAPKKQPNEKLPVVETQKIIKAEKTLIVKKAPKKKLKPKSQNVKKKVKKNIPVAEIKPEDLAPIPPGEKKEEIKKKLILPKRVTSIPARTAVPEVKIPDKDPNLTNKNIDEQPVAEKVDITTSLSEALLSGHKRGVKMTMSDILEAYEQGSVSNN